MLNYRILAVLKRELKERLFSKAFIITTFLIPGLMIFVVGLQVLLRSTESKNLNFEFITEDQKLIDRFKKELLQSDFVTKRNYNFNFYSMSKEKLYEYIQKKRNEITEEKLTGIIFIPSSTLKDKRVEYYSKSPQNLTLSRELEEPINKVLVDVYFMNKALSQEELNFVRKGIDFSGFKVSKDENIKKEGYGNLILAYVFSLLLYISLLVIGQLTMQSVIEEKSNRIVEIVLSSVNPKELMIGKILGASITGLVQMGIWIFTIIGITSFSWVMLPEDLIMTIDPKIVAYVLLSFFIGLVLFISLFATIGAIFDNPQDASSGIAPIIMLIIVPFFIAISIMEDPNKPYAEIASMLPFFSVIVMPSRMSLVDVPNWQLFVSILLNILSIFALFPIAGKIYRVGILVTGKKPKWSEVIRWLKYKY
ncbi:MAG: ABC transporter permease [Melioribacter sp.]|nr:ABC transporter permease [Melioribacter sp.]